MPNLGPGTVATEPIPGVTLACMAPEYRDCLDAVMEAWREHFQERIATGLPSPIKEADDVYGFAYWLIRWSGLVVPAKIVTRVEVAR